MPISRQLASVNKLCMGLTFRLVLVKLALNPYIFVLIIWSCMVLSLHLQRRLGQAVIDILNIQTPARSRRTQNIVINQLNLLRGRPIFGARPTRGQYNN